MQNLLHIVATYVLAPWSHPLCVFSSYMIWLFFFSLSFSLLPPLLLLISCSLSFTHSTLFEKLTDKPWFVSDQIIYNLMHKADTHIHNSTQGKYNQQNTKFVSKILLGFRDWEILLAKENSFCQMKSME